MKSRSAILDKARNRRRRRRQVLATISVLIVLVVLALLWWLSHSDKFLITEVQVAGAVATAPAPIRAAAEAELAGNYFFIFPRRHTLWYPGRSIAAQILAAHPRISRVDISRESLTQIKITVAERSPAFMVCSEQCFFADQAGLVYAPAPTFSAPIYLIWDLASDTPAIGKRVLSAANFSTVQSAANYFNQVFKHRDLTNWRAVRVKPLGNGDYELTFSLANSSRRLPILITDRATPTTSARNLDLTLSRLLGTSTPKLLPNLEYLDLRFGNKVFYKL